MHCLRRLRALPDLHLLATRACLPSSPTSSTISQPTAIACYSLLQLGDAAFALSRRLRGSNYAMSSSVSPYAALPPIRSSLFHNPSDTLPPVDELDVLRLELEAFKAQSLERAKKAGDDIRTIEESMRRLKEKEKGKAKAIQKAERERGRAYYLTLHLLLCLLVSWSLLHHSFMNHT